MRRAATLLLLAAWAAFLPSATSGQVLADPVLRGRTLLGDTVLAPATVVLHRVSTETQGEVDSVTVNRDGTFIFRLPTVPDPGRSEVYFASVRHQGILYFGKAVTVAVQLDSLYQIQAYDTLMAPPEGFPVPLQARNLFLEPGDGNRWRVTDLFQLRNEESRTLVAPEGGYVWRHPLPSGATEVTMADGDFGSAGAEARGGALVVTTPLPPGERLFVVRYTVPDPFLDLSFPFPTDVLEVLIQEPAPPLEAPGLTAVPGVELDPGVTFRRLVGEDLGGREIRLVEGKEQRPPPVRWLAVILALVLAGVGVWAVQRGGGVERRVASDAPALDRQGLILEVAKLDEAFEARSDPTPEERGAYEARRRALLRRLTQLD